MRLNYDKDYTNTFHSPGIEPWISGFLKSKGSLGKVIDIGCGLGFSAFLLKLYLGTVEYLVGVDISQDKISKAEKLGLYDELIIADISDFKPKEKFDTLIAIESLHGLPANILLSIKNLVNENGTIVIALPCVPKGISVKDLLDQGYEVYKYILRGFLLVDLKRYTVYLVGESLLLRLLKFSLELFKPILKATRTLEKGYLLVFK